MIEVFLTEPASISGEVTGEENAGNEKHNIWGKIQGIVDDEYDDLRDIVQTISLIYT